MADSQLEYGHSAKSCYRESCSSFKILFLLCTKDIFFASNYSDIFCILYVDLSRSSSDIAPSYCITRYRCHKRDDLIPSPLYILLCSRIFYIFSFKFSRFPFKLIFIIKSKQAAIIIFLFSRSSKGYQHQKMKKQI